MIDGLEDAIRARDQRLYDEAETLFAALLSSYPDDALTHYHYAWTCDAQGKEQQAVLFYEKAIDLGLPSADLQGALLGLGSTYRALGEYQKAAARLQRGLVQFPDALEFTVFYAMVLYNLGQPSGSNEPVAAVGCRSCSGRKYRSLSARYSHLCARFR